MGTITVKKIPLETLVPILSEKQQVLGRCCDNFLTYDYEKVRELCGPEFASMPLDDVRRQCINARKKGLVVGVKHGPSKRQPLSGELVRYYTSVEWKSYAERVKAYWGYRCCLCDSDKKLEVHHRSYERLYHELPTDCVALCSKCHKHADKRRRAESGAAPSLF